ncbi:MAG: SH3 domain-containing protein, partial [Hyphomicrobiaceae bacterium]
QRRRAPQPVMAKATTQPQALPARRMPEARAPQAKEVARLQVTPKLRSRRSFSQPVAPPTQKSRLAPPDPVNEPQRTPKRIFRVVGVEANDRLNIRENPDSDSAIVARIPPFATGIRMLGSCVAEWCKIRYRNRRGWVHTAYVAPEANLSAKQNTRRSSASRSYRVVGVRSTDVLNMRIGPSSDAPVVATIPPSGRGVRIIGECAGDWCPITYRFVSGWVNRYYIARET